METLKKQNEQINRLSLNSEEAVRNNLDCFRATTACLEHCLNLGGKHSEQNHITILKECAEVCQITASFLIEGSDFTHDICSICARLCDLCSDSCNEIGPDDPIMNACITACRRCAESCRSMEH